MEGTRLVRSTVGLGRIPTFWFTQNPCYNEVYEVHRMNVGASHIREALLSRADGHKDVRFAFTRDAPDIMSFMLALRQEFMMRVVMPSVVPHSSSQPFRSMARAEWGSNGNPHWHGFAVGSTGPQLGRVRADVGDDGPGDEPAGSENGDGGGESSSGSSSEPGSWRRRGEEESLLESCCEQCQEAIASFGGGVAFRRSVARVFAQCKKSVRQGSVQEAVEVLSLSSQWLDRTVVALMHAVMPKNDVLPGLKWIRWQVGQVLRGMEEGLVPMPSVIGEGACGDAEGVSSLDSLLPVCGLVSARVPTKSRAAEAEALSLCLSFFSFSVSGSRSLSFLSLFLSFPLSLSCSFCLVSV